MLPKANDPRDWAKYEKLRNTINNNIKTSNSLRTADVSPRSATMSEEKRLPFAG